MGQKMSMVPGSRHISCAFTLPEVLLASVILAFTVAALTQAVIAGQMQTYASIHEMRAIELAESLIDEMLLLDYDDPDGGSTLGPDAGEATFADFDNIDDYHNFSQTAGNLTDITGQLLHESYQTFSRSVVIAEQTENKPVLGGSINGLNIEVNVTDQDGKQWRIERWITQPN